MSQLNPYLNFDGQAREAMEFYASVLGGTPSVMTFADAGATDHPDPSQVMHAQLVTDAGYVLMASDMAPGEAAQQGNRVHLCLNGDETDELHRCFDGLSAGGTVHVPLEKQMWGDEFGAFNDKYGQSWMVNIGAPRS